MITDEIVEVYKNWEREKDYLDLNLKTLRKLNLLNEIASDEVLNKINSLAYFLHTNNYEKPSEQYLNDLKMIVDSSVTIIKYFQAQRAFDIELSSYYPIPTEENPEVCKEHNSDTIKLLQSKARTEQKAFYAMIKELYLYGEIKAYKNKKIAALLDTLKKSPHFVFCKTTKSESEIMRFFEMKYRVESNESILKIGMQDLYDYFSERFSEFEPMHFCNEILEHIFTERPKQKRYYTDPQDSTRTKTSFDGQTVHEISSIRK